MSEERKERFLETANAMQDLTKETVIYYALAFLLSAVCDADEPGTAAVIQNLLARCDIDMKCPEFEGPR